VRSKNSNAGRFARYALVALLILAVIAAVIISCFKNSGQDTWLEDIRLANDKLKAGNYLAAEELYSKARKQCEDRFGANDARTGTCLGYLAELYRGEQEYVKAAATYKTLIAIEQRCAPNSAELERDINEYQSVLAKVKEYGLEDPVNQPHTGLEQLPEWQKTKSAP
jgi:tetratricopeptide (TPR) repeat protein